MAISELVKISPIIDLPLHLKNRGVKNIDSVIVGQPEFFKSLNDVIKNTPIEILKEYVDVYKRQVKHRYLSFATKYWFQFCISIDHTFVFSILKLVSFDVIPNFLYCTCTRNSFATNDLSLIHILFV